MLTLLRNSPDRGNELFRSKFAAPLIVICAATIGTSQAHAGDCPTSPVDPSLTLKPGTARIDGKSRRVRGAGDSIDVSWTDRRLGPARLYWFKGCLRGEFESSNDQSASRTDGRYRAKFIPRSLPRGRLDLWVEFERWPGPGEGSEAWTEITSVGQVYVPHRISRLDPSVEVGTNEFTDPPPDSNAPPPDRSSTTTDIYSVLTITTQRRLLTRNILTIQTCRARRCRPFRRARKRTPIAARSYSEVEPGGADWTVQFRWNLSYEPRESILVELRLSPAEKQTLRDAIEAGASVRAVTRMTLSDPRDLRTLFRARKAIEIGRGDLPRPGERL